MVSLYVKFIVLVVAFVSISLGVQWYIARQLITKKEDNRPSITSSGDVGFLITTKIRIRNPHNNLDKLFVKTPCTGDHCILNGVSGVVQNYDLDITQKIQFGSQKDGITKSMILQKTVKERNKVRNKFNTIGKVKMVSKLYDRDKIDKMVVKLQDMNVLKVNKLHKQNMTSNQTKTNILGRLNSKQQLGTQHAELNITSELGLPVKNVRRVGIWNTDSGQDRILEQMAYIPKPRRSVRPKGILLDGGVYSWDVKHGSATFKEHKCRVQNCKILEARRNDTEVDAVLLSQSLSQIESYAKNLRQPNIVWLFFALESPMATYDYSSLMKYVNWTATYRSDSTIVAPYEKWVYHKNDKAAKKAKRNYAEGKTKMAAIFVSNCAAVNGRLNYVYDLQKNISVDIYGYCGNQRCPRNNDKCSRKLNKDYKFYLAFENANCKDYITEKFFVNGLRHDVIPVVMGAKREEYEKVAPPHSFIHVEDFKSPEELASYLHKLDQNDDLFNQYFEWKGTGAFLNTKFWCRLCALLNEEDKPELSVNLEEWWRPKNVCTSGRWDALK